ncbi:unnamed protein product [Calypogeia fissa]
MGLRSLRSRWGYGNLAGNFVSRFLSSSGGPKRWAAAPDCSRERIQVSCFLQQAKLTGYGRFAGNVGGFGHRCFVGIERVREHPLRSYSISAEGGFRRWCNVRYLAGVSWQDANQAPRLLVVQPRIHPLPVLKAKLLEALRLADSLQDSRKHHQQQQNGSRTQKKQLLPPYVLVQSPSSTGRSSSSKRLQARAYFGAGTIDIVRAHVDEIDTQGRIDAVFVNVPLSGVQQRNLEDAWGKPVLDRVGLIIEIFGAHAKSKAARLQVELASLYYKRSRLVRARGSGGARLGFGAGGESEVVSARGRATGAIGGAGETEIQLQRRRVGERQHRLKLLLAEVARTQSLHRAARQRQGYATGHGSRLPVVAVVGYTNAGKTSLVAALSQSSLYIDDKLFATLDTRSRRVVLPSGQTVILSDTVGFISDLPTQLVKAFQSTLDEVVEADYLLHVIDSSAPNASEQRETVLQVLEGIGTPKHKLQNYLLEVWNKADLAEGGQEIGRAVGLEGNMNSSELQYKGQISSQEAELIVDTDHSQLIQAVHVVENIPEERAEILGVEWSNEGVSCVATSARTKMGLKELCHLLDRKLRFELGRQPEVEVEESF